MSALAAVWQEGKQMKKNVIVNVILDVGMVLVNFCWQDVLKDMGLSGEAFEAVANATVRTQEWNEYDRSVISDEKILDAFQKKAPEYASQIEDFWNRIGDMIVQYPYAKQWIKSLKEAGYQVYILSNYSRRTYEHTRADGLSFLPLTDGAVFSFETGYVKPEKEIYHVLMDKYHLKPEECVFIDDNDDNLVYPNQIGWGTIPFRTFAQVQNALQEEYGVKYQTVV